MRVSGTNRSRHKRSGASRTDVLITVVGLIAAAAAGVAAYGVVGPYGDGPIDVGLYRAEDPETGVQLVYRKVSAPGGGEVRYIFDDATRRLKEVRLIREGQPDVVTAGAISRSAAEAQEPVHSITRDDRTGEIKMAFSLRGNGVIDAWEYRDGKGQLQRIEISRAQNGVIDRWEYYQDNQLARVEEDEDRNGRVDRWLTFDAGILVKEVRDRDGDGRPDPPGR